MIRHLFLEGPIQEGKSTLIRSRIRDHLPQVGGFSSQRLLDSSGKTVGFRIAPPEEAMALTAEYSPELSGVFLYFDGEKTEAKPELFAGTAVSYLRERKGKKLILLDEIGGVELLEPEFRKELYAALEGDIPCLGVLKLEISMRNMCKNTDIDRDCVDYHLKLREDLARRFGADIVRFERNRTKEPERALNEFIHTIFGESGV